VAGKGSPLPLAPHHAAGGHTDSDWKTIMTISYQSAPRILLVEDDESLRLTQALYLRREGFTVGAVADRGAARRELEVHAYDVVVTDLRLGEDNGLAVLADVRQQQADTEVLVITGYGSVDSAVTAMRAGAYDYLTKPVDPEHLVRVLHKALERQRLRRQVSYLQDQYAREAGLQRIVAESPPMKAILETLQQVAESDASVLIEGESGTGKELLAKLIHRRGNRATGPFLALNCGALPETLLESELFGHVRGSFTGAHRDHKGLFEAAHGGTLFLDEIAETSTGFQVKLLRALQEHTIRRLGDTREIPVDVRIIAASNQNLGELVHKGRFRPDLFFRLKVIPIRLPPLRERREDILPLAQSTLARVSNRMGRRHPKLSRDAEQRLLAYDWPGNVRELENVLERALIFNKSDSIEVAELLLDSALLAQCRDANPAEAALIPLAEAEKRHILQVLDRCGHNKRKAAQVLKIGYNTLWRKLARYGLDEEP
jgi:DNA-binding NtrC family response regulator